MKNKVLILGAKGMLGQELTRVYAADERYEVMAWDIDDIDVTNFSGAEKKIKSVGAKIIFNAVAYNAVDACETSEEEYQKALKLNRDVPGFLARIAKRRDVLLVHYSTDYVFGQDDQEHLSGYTEMDTPQPKCRYAQSKRAGEEEVAREAEKYYIVRLSKLFGKPATSAQGKRSFFDVMLEVGRTKNEVSVVRGEVSCFTYAPDLAQASKELVESREVSGVYHLVNTGAVTWYDGVVELYRQAGIATRVVPVGPEAFPRPAERPQWSVLLNTKRPPLRPYQEALVEYLKSHETNLML
jgi:dTDP-4-dehydrorhamnose reductase